MKQLITVILSFTLLCGCQEKAGEGARLDKTGAENISHSSPPPDAEEIVNQSLAMMRRDLEIFLAAEEYEAALMQIGHYRDSVNLFPQITPAAERFRDGELLYYSSICLIKTGEKEQARERFQRGLKNCPEPWKEKVQNILGELDN